jgi:siroheme synthase
MGAGLAQEISAELIARGKPKATPLVLVESATLPERRIFRGTLAELPALALGSGGGPAVVLLGEVLGTALAEPVLAEKIEAILKRA